MLWSILPKATSSPATIMSSIRPSSAISRRCRWPLSTPRGFMPAAGRPAVLALAACLALAVPFGAVAAAEDYPGFAWMSGAGDGNALLTYGSPDTGEDYLFNLSCGNKDTSSRATLYVDIEGTKVGQKI